MTVSVDISDEAVERIVELGFWFVDIPRTSSTSLKAQLSERFGPIFGKKGETQGVMEGLVPDHTPAAVLRERMGAACWDRLVTFSVVRNPWERTLSMYLFRRHIAAESLKMDFRDYVLKLGARDSAYFGYHGHYFGNSDYVLGADGEPLVSHIACYESRKEDLEAVGEAIGFAELGQGQRMISRSTHCHYSRYYDDEMVAIVADRYRTDRELFQYEFERAWEVA